MLRASLAMPGVFFCLSIDCECDKGPAWRSQKPRRFTGIAVGLAGRIHPLCRAWGVVPTYLLSPEVLQDEACVAELAALENEAELGTHLHGEYVDPGAFDPDVTADFQRNYPPEVERQKLTALTALFRSAFRRAPRSFRAGRFGIGPSTLSFLHELGYEVESSVTPHIDWSGAGAPGLSFVGAPTQPYHPEASDPVRLGASPLLEVPVTVRPNALAALPLVGRWLEARWLRPTFQTGPGLIALARDEIASAGRDRPVILNAMLHNVEVVAGASPYAKNDDEAKVILARLAELFAWLKREGIRSVGLADVPSLATWPGRQAAA